MSRTTLRDELCGAGSGFFFEVLLYAHPRTRAVCIDPKSDKQLAVSTRRPSFSGHDTADAADLYLFMHVIEHVPDDLAMVGAYARNAPVKATLRLGPSFPVLVERP